MPGPGSEASYRLTGGPLSTPDAPVVLFDWGPGGSREGQDSMRSFDGETLVLHIGDVRTVMDRYLKERPAQQVSIGIRPHGADGPSSIIEEFMDVDGTLVQYQSPRFAIQNDEPLHQVRFTRDGRVAALGLSWFWKAALGDGDVIDRPYPNEQPLPIVGPGESVFQATVSTRDVAGACRADVEVTWGNGSGIEPLREYGYRFSWQDGDPFPETITWGRESVLEARLQEVLPGSGQAAWAADHEQRVAAAASPVPLVSPQQFIDDGWTAFPTSLRQAVDAASAYEPYQQWAQGRDPDPTRFKHRLGAPGTDLRDQWLIEFVDGEEGYRVTVHNTSHPIPVLDQGAQGVSGGPEPWNGAMQAPARVLPSRNMEQAHDRLYGRAPETVECDLRADYCYVGTHDSTLRAHAGGSGGGATRPGLVFWLSNGWLLQDDSADPAPVAPSPWGP